MPGSTTYLMPGTVSEVSATLVASTTRRPPVRLEHAVLLGRGQPGVQRQHLQAGEVRPVGQRIGGVPDLPLAAEEDQDIARAFGAQFRDRVADALDLVLRLAAWPVRVGKRPVAHLDRVHPPGHLDDRRPVARLVRFGSATLLVCFGSATLLVCFGSATLPV